MENERFELKTVAHTVEMAVSSSKMLQIAWKMVRTGNPKKIPQKQFPTPFGFFWVVAELGCLDSTRVTSAMLLMFFLSGHVTMQRAQFSELSVLGLP